MTTTKFWTKVRNALTFGLLRCPYCGADYACDCLERANCNQAGELGHSGCGRCDHDGITPRFACSTCFAKAVDDLS